MTQLLHRLRDRAFGVAARTVFKLTINMRLLRPGLTTAEAQQARSFVGGNLVTLAILLL